MGWVAGSRGWDSDVDFAAADCLAASNARSVGRPPTASQRPAPSRSPPVSRTGCGVAGCPFVYFTRFCHCQRPATWIRLQQTRIASQKRARSISVSGMPPMHMHPWARLPLLFSGRFLWAGCCRMEAAGLVLLLRERGYDNAYQCAHPCLRYMHGPCQVVHSRYLRSLIP